MREIDLGDRTIAPGFVDLHVHGGAGVDLSGDDPDEVADSVGRISAFHAAHGTTALVATTVSDTPARLAATLAGIARATGRTAGGGRVVGAHLEGPFLARGRAGAHRPEALRLPDPGELDRLTAAAAGTLRIVTLAPELPGGLDLVERVVARGAVAALGHSDATYEQALAAIDRGASHLTHLFNAMSPLHHRHPGLAGAGLVAEGVTLEVIADGHHLHPGILRLLGRLAPERVVAVSDATAAAGLPAGRHRLGPVDVDLEGDRVALAGRPEVLAGSALTMDRAVAALVASGGFDLAAALRAASAVPAAVLRGAAGPGELVEGAPADLVVLEADLRVAATLVGGEPVADPAGLFA